LMNDKSNVKKKKRSGITRKGGGEKRRINVPGREETPAGEGGETHRIIKRKKKSKTNLETGASLSPTLSLTKKERKR